MDVEAGDDGGPVSLLQPIVGPRRRGPRRCCPCCSSVPLYTYFVNFMLALLLILVFVSLVYALKDYLKSALEWVETQNPWLVFALFVLLFILVSFPIAFGYLILIISSGYLLGVVRGMITVLIGANVGVATAHFTIRPLSKLVSFRSTLRNETARAMLRVISGPQAFRIVLFARLTPVPFGVQNTIFAISEVGGVGFHAASAIGLFPAQIINVYLGSTLRSMHDVLQESHITGYVVFIFQIAIGISLMVWIVQKARKELAIALTEAENAQEGGLSSSSSSTSLIS